MIALSLFILLILLLFVVRITERTDAQRAADWVRQQPDLDEWHTGLLSAVASGDESWKLDALEEIMKYGDSKDAVRLKEWMQWVDEAQG